MGMQLLKHRFRFDGQCETRHVDCRKARGLPDLDDLSVDVMISDPPYDPESHANQRAGAGRGRVVKTRVVGFEALSDADRRLIAVQAARVVRRWVVLFCSIEDVRAWRDDLELAGLDYVQTMVWYKPGAAPQFNGKGPAQACEAIVVAHQPGRRHWNGGGRHGYFEHPPVRSRGDVDGWPRVHETQKPIALMRELIELFSDKGELVLDPFAGSGTTGAAALELGRSFLGMERRDLDVKRARRRLLRAAVRA